MDMGSSEDCLSEAEECDRLAGLARSEAMRQIMMVLAFKWRRLAKMADERKANERPGESLQDLFWKRG